MFIIRKKKEKSRYKKTKNEKIKKNFRETLIQQTLSSVSLDELVLFRETSEPHFVLRIVRAKGKNCVGERLAVHIARMDTDEKHPVRLAFDRIIFRIHAFSSGKNE